MKNILFLLLCCVCCSCSVKKDWNNPVTPPAKVMSAFESKYPGVKGNDWKARRKKHYSTSFSLENGKSLDVLMTEDGIVSKLLEETDQNDLPKAVQEASAKYITGTTMKVNRYWKETMDGKIIYRQSMTDTSTGEAWVNKFDEQGKYIGKDKMSRKFRARF